MAQSHPCTSTTTDGDGEIQFILHHASCKEQDYIMLRKRISRLLMRLLPEPLRVDSESRQRIVDQWIIDCLRQATPGLRGNCSSGNGKNGCLYVEAHKCNGRKKSKVTVIGLNRNFGKFAFTRFTVTKHGLENKEAKRWVAIFQRIHCTTTSKAAIIREIPSPATHKLQHFDNMLEILLEEIKQLHEKLPSLFQEQLSLCNRLVHLGARRRCIFLILHIAASTQLIEASFNMDSAKALGFYQMTVRLPQDFRQLFEKYFPKHCRDDDSMLAALAKFGLVPADPRSDWKATKWINVDTICRDEATDKERTEREGMGENDGETTDEERGDGEDELGEETRKKLSGCFNPPLWGGTDQMIAPAQLAADRPPPTPPPLPSSTTRLWASFEPASPVWVDGAMGGCPPRSESPLLSRFPDSPPPTLSSELPSSHSVLGASSAFPCASRTESGQGVAGAGAEFSKFGFFSWD